MSQVSTFIESYKFYRQRTLGLLDKIETRPDGSAVLGWRPGAGRAHIGWQLMHIGVTEDLFASERLAPHRPARFGHLWERFRGGSTPDDNPLEPSLVREVLEQSRLSLLETLGEYPDSRLAEIPPSMAARKLTVQDVLYIIGWHEAHHQGQAHITFNLYAAAHP